MELRIRFGIFFLCLAWTFQATAETVHFTPASMNYLGAFRIPVGTQGDGRMGFANGAFAVHSQRQSFYVVGHAQFQSVAEFNIPALSDSLELTDLPMAEVAQPFVRLLRRTPDENPQDLNTITGLAIINDELFLNAAQYYDASASRTHTTFVLTDPSDLANGEVRGFYQLAARHRAAGWISPVPPGLQNEVGYDYLFGNASNLPINGRNSMGPSAYGVRSEDLFDLSTHDLIDTAGMLHYSIANQLHADHYNNSGENDIWTEVSKAFYGFLVPGTRTYAVFGSSGGHDSGIGYKITQDTGRVCGGGCPYIASDVYSHYWLYDLDDLLAVRDGYRQPHSVKPFDYGRLNLPFNDTHPDGIPNVIIGAHYDTPNDRLYLLLGNADRLQSRFESAPVMLVYSLGLDKPRPPLSFTLQFH